jgi:UDP-N-acetyl-D-mannosaminuronic acid transferase (WecB/TagA/CpsF family)
MPTILGISFFDGNVEAALDRMSGGGGVLIAPSGTCFARLRHDAIYRDAVARADLAIADSGAMVLLWRLLRGRKLERISGLKYIRHFSARIFQAPMPVLWVLPNESAREKTSGWLRDHGFAFAPEDLYVAPHYAPVVADPKLVALLEQRKPSHIVIGIGSGPQEKLGVYLRDRLSYRPAIHCVGAALGFLTGDQAAIPEWADHFYLGWLLRLFAQPRIFLPRLLRAAALPWLIFRYAEELPPLREK